ncbi:uncharacterized protein NEMAJ01_0475 [Nematocida major]|uniref:uncharacterized protein n=1 Tax=Nematocida major TaxID=1912982 RepID=UPI00200875CD|nr:uncharacterized protein NEMAJ01_0475 [Nematocida major]KAH9385579.1 hypothetical protein NEMAJ01_0475 [Nematocida major]
MAVIQCLLLVVAAVLARAGSEENLASFGRARSGVDLRIIPLLQNHAKACIEILDKEGDPSPATSCTNLTTCMMYFSAYLAEGGVPSLYDATSIALNFAEHYIDPIITQHKNTIEDETIMMFVRACNYESSNPTRLYDAGFILGYISMSIKKIAEAHNTMVVNKDTKQEELFVLTAHEVLKLKWVAKLHYLFMQLLFMTDYNTHTYINIRYIGIAEDYMSAFNPYPPLCEALANMSIE